MSRIMLVDDEKNILSALRRVLMTGDGIEGETEEVTVELFDTPAEALKRAEVVAFARFLLSRAEHPDDEAWETRLADPKPRTKLSEFLRVGMAEGGDEPLDIRRL